MVDYQINIMQMSNLGPAQIVEEINKLQITQQQDSAQMDERHSVKIVKKKKQL